MGKLAMEMLGARSMTQEWLLASELMPSYLYADASVALSIAKRQGAGKKRRINKKRLWLQENEVQNIVEHVKATGEKIPLIA